MIRADLHCELEAGAYLRPLAAADATQGYVDGLNDPVVHEFLVGPRARRQTLESVREFIAANERDPHGVLFGLYVGDILRGTSRLHDIDPVAGKAFIGIALFDRAVWGQGWGSKVIGGVCRCAGQHLDLREVWAGIEESNVRSQKAFARAGFVPQDEVAQGGGGVILRYWSKNLSVVPLSEARR